MAELKKIDIRTENCRGYERKLIWNESKWKENEGKWIANEKKTKEIWMENARKVKAKKKGIERKWKVMLGNEMKNEWNM